MKRFRIGQIGFFKKIAEEVISGAERVQARVHGARLSDIQCICTKVDELELNSNCIDPKQKVELHTLRHTYARWLVQSGIPIYEVAKHLGHSTITMTERYSHLSQMNFENSVKVIEIVIFQAMQPKTIIGEGK